ncbi:hypothetical protein K7472_10300 [Streptomyces sp. PTM05]|uniref:Uncharacterized protein n=1 Tax=Streptantibioticus parmotrematis TaxID=2873249 RepID=A0ABS7QPX3_9ACTN|nr:hypothetical protein [Streptantibioticus parmotrematis]MBY8885235.1 hypothetical protein [Streptantibioticus parmotrematis]
MTVVDPAAPTGSVPATAHDLVGHVTRTSAELMRRAEPLDADTAVAEVRDHAVQLGLEPADLSGHLWRGLEQNGTLGPDETAEYRRNLRTLLDATGVADPRRPTPVELFAVFHRLGREVASTLAAALPRDPGRTTVFLGTDAEFLKTVHDLLADRTDTSSVFYLSRLQLLSGAERAVLSRTSRAVFGAEEVTARGHAGRHRAWMDNGLVASTMARMLTAAREDAVRSAADRQSAADREEDSDPFDALFLARFAEEVRRGTDQRRRLAEGPLTLFGTARAETDAVVRRGIEEGLFAARCLDAGRRLLDGAADGRPLTLVDIGANGTQPALLMGAAHVLRPAADVSIRLFTSHPDRWGRPGSRFRPAKASALFALGVETVKTFATDYHGAARGAGHTLVRVPPDQRLLARLKHLAFHRAALEVRAHGGPPPG